MMTEAASATPKVVIGVVKESTAGEQRVAFTPDGVKRYASAGHTVLVQRNAGAGAFISDDHFRTAGATIVSGDEVWSGADIVLGIHKPSLEQVAAMREGATLIAFLQPMINLDLVEELRKRKITALSMDAIPRTTRAQYMDALSSQATIAGYKAVLLAAAAAPKFFPLLTTAAGNIPPAKVLVIGAGVAGLMAIGTARRLGAVVEAYDARAVVKEQVESLGARFVEIDTGADLAGAGGYAREATEDILAKQQAGLATRAAKSDVVITTAAVPGRRAPLLIPASTVEAMQPGSIIVDLAAETGGNCELTQAGKTIVEHGVTIIGAGNLPSTVPVDGSQMYSKNLQNLLALLITKDGQLVFDMNDEIVAGTVITRDGEVIHEGTRERLAAASSATS